MRRIMWLALVLVFLASPSFAASRCYSPTEMQAEQLLRLHSELMVITVTCHQGSQGQDLVSAYTGFTNRNIDSLHEAETTMASYYKKNYSGDSTERLDKLRTLLANEIGQQVANASAPAFCAQRRDKVLLFTNKSSTDVKNESLAMMVSSHTYDPPCGAAIQMAHKN